MHGHHNVKGVELAGRGFATNIATMSSFPVFTIQQSSPLIVVIQRKKLECHKLGHEKVRYIKHSNLNQPQDFIVSNRFTNKEKS